jgi:hypothetical protein
MKLQRLFILFLVIFSCKTMDDIVVESISDEDYRNIDQADLLILRYRMDKTPELLAQIKTEIKNLEKNNKNHKKYEAIILGLYGAVELLENNTVSVKNTVNEIQKRNPNEERYFLLSAELENDRTKKEEIIRTGIEKADTNQKLKLFLADLYFLSGDFTKAVELYDDAIGQLAAEFKVFYKTRRDVAYLFINHPPRSRDTIELVQKKELSIRDLIRLSVNEILILSGYLGSQNLSGESLFDKMKNDSFFYHSQFTSLKLNDPVKRRDVAYFVLKTISMIENNPLLIQKYNKEYSANKDKSAEIFKISPVPDISPSDYFYTAALILVERELLDLPDGINFKPEESLNGEQYYELIRKLNRMKKK